MCQSTTTPPTTPSPLPFPFTTTSPPPTLITQGAEALLYKTHFITPSQPAALKVRPSKPYRHRILDERLTKQRVLAEARVLVKLSGVGGGDGKSGDGVRVPKVLGLEWDVGRRVRRFGGRRVQEGRRGDATDGKGESEATEPAGPVKVDGGTEEAASTNAVNETDPRKGMKGAWLLMEWIDGPTLKDLVRRWDIWKKAQIKEGTEEGKEDEEFKGLLRRVGRAVGVMHSKGGVVHGDLTSSNILIQQQQGGTVVDENPRDDAMPDLKGEIVLIDFGLATQSIQDEDRAVDLYVLERAFGSTHPRQEKWFDQEVLQCEEGYRGSYKGANVVLKRLEDVRLRGRKRSMVG